MTSSLPNRIADTEKGLEEEKLLDTSHSSPPLLRNCAQSYLFYRQKEGLCKPVHFLGNVVTDILYAIFSQT